MESDYFAGGWCVVALCGGFEMVSVDVHEVIVAGWWRGWELCSELGSFGTTVKIEGVNIWRTYHIFMELDDCINGRRCIRRYKDDVVPKDIIDKILHAGVWAPSGMNGQPWRFIVIEERDTINKLSQRTKEILLNLQWPDNLKESFKLEEDTIFYGAPLLILTCVQKIEDFKTVHLLDCGLAAENMFLTSYQEGVGSCFIGFGNFLNQDPDLLAEVGVPKDHELIAPLIFGYPAENPAPKPREVKILNWIK